MSNIPNNSKTTASKTKKTTASNYKKRKITDAQLLELYDNTSTLLSRAALQNAIGKGFDGNRDYNAVFGYPDDLSYATLFEKYDRDGIASRAVDGIPDETWRIKPIIHDGDINPKKGNEQNEVTDFEKKWAELEREHHITSLLLEADKMLGYSRWSVIYLGASGEPSEPLTTTSQISFLDVFDENTAKVASEEENINDERYGLPLLYNIEFDGGTKVVHHSRVIHFRNGRERGSRYKGVARLRKVFNYILDLGKVIGGSSEAFWLLIRKGIALVAREGVDLPQRGTPEFEALESEIDEYEHQLRRIIKLRGVDVKDLGSDVPNARSQFDILIAVTAGTIPMPQRILIGSEAGQLASNQDEVNFRKTIATRQTNYCAPFMLDLVIQKMIDINVLPKPKNGKHSIEWLPLYEQTLEEKMNVASSAADALDKVTGGSPETAMLLEDYMQQFFGYKMPEILKNLYHSPDTANE